MLHTFAESEKYIEDCRPSISALFKHFSSKNVLVVEGDSLKIPTKSLWFDDTSEVALFLEFAALVPILLTYKPSLAKSISSRSSKIASNLTPTFTESELQQMCDMDEKTQQKPEKNYRRADVYEEVLSSHSDKRHICQLIRLIIIFSTNSAGPERGFLLQNRIKDQYLRKCVSVSGNPIGDD
jgi:hypothetical protein